MLYDIRLALRYEYDAPVSGGRHLVRVVPVSVPGAQRVVAASLQCDPAPVSQSRFTDFFGNEVSGLVYRKAHDALSIKLSARVLVETTTAPIDISPPASGLASELGRVTSLVPSSPHHFLSPSPRVPLSHAITEYARDIVAGAASVEAGVFALCSAINADFAYDGEATDVDTTPEEAFALRRGVCQDFAHVMIAGLRGMGVPAGYVSGFLRTNPPAGKPRLEGADAMHAWVRVWCGLDMGWLAFDPTNAMHAGVDHITVAVGRDYADTSPIVGVLRTTGSHEASQSVDVVCL